MTIRRIIFAVAMWAAFGLVVLIGTYAHADDGYTCADVRAAVATVARGAGVSRVRAVEIIETTARGAGATEDQIARAKRCLPSFNR